MKRTIVSLFTGAGGLDLGFEAAGFETKLAVEMDEACCDTLSINRPNWNVINSAIELVPTSEILKRSGLKKKEPTLLIGGPPCQPFSKSGYWKTGDVKRLKDPRANTIKEFLRVLEDTLPFAFVIENVYGLAYEGKDEGLKFIESRIKEINLRNGTSYSFNWDIINAADFGVPQIRERVFIVGCRDGSEFIFPEPRYFSDSHVAQNPQLEKHRTAWDALWDLDFEHSNNSPLKIGGKFGHLLSSIPEGQNYLYHTDRGGGKPIFKWRSRYWSFLLKLAKDKPSWTIQAQPGSAIGPFHWRNRKLTIEEICRLQTFPEGYNLCGSVSEIQKQLGNAVPSAIGELLGLEIRRQLLREKVSSKKLKLVPEKAPKLFNERRKISGDEVES